MCVLAWLFQQFEISLSPAGTVSVYLICRGSALRNGTRGCLTVTLENTMARLLEYGAEESKVKSSVPIQTHGAQLL